MPPKKSGDKDKDKDAKKKKAKEEEQKRRKDLLNAIRRAYAEKCSSLAVPPWTPLVQKLRGAADGEDGEVPEGFPLIISDTLSPVGVQSIMETLSAFPGFIIKKLSFYRVNVGDEGAFHIADFLHKNTTLQLLELVDCGISSRGAADLGRVLGPELSAPLQSLNLDFNPLGDEGVAAVSSGIAWNGTDAVALDDISMEFVNVGPEGAEALATQVLAKGKLKKLSLKGNPTGPKGVTAIAKAIQTHGKLEVLDLSDNAFCHDPAAMSALASGIRVNESLLVVKLGGSALPPEIANEILETLKSKPKLQIETAEYMDSAIFQQIAILSAEHKEAMKPKKGKKGKKGGKKKK